MTSDMPHIFVSFAAISEVALLVLVVKMTPQDDVRKYSPSLSGWKRHSTRYLALARTFKSGPSVLPPLLMHLLLPTSRVKPTVEAA